MTRRKLAITEERLKDLLRRDWMAGFETEDFYGDDDDTHRQDLSVFDLIREAKQEADFDIRKLNLRPLEFNRPSETPDVDETVLANARAM